MYRKSATAQYAAIIKNSKISAGPVRHAPTAESTVNVAPQAVINAPRCGNPNQIPAASTRPVCSTQKRAQEALALSAPFCSIATNTAAVDKSQFKTAQVIPTRTSMPNHSRDASPTETWVDAQNELAIRMAPTPPTLAARNTATRKKFNANKDRSIRRLVRRRGPWSI